MSYLSLLHPIVPWRVDLFDRFVGKLKFVAFFLGWEATGYRLLLSVTLCLRSRGRLSLVKAVLHPTINSTRHVYLRSRLFPTISFPPHFPPRPPSPPASPGTLAEIRQQSSSPSQQLTSGRHPLSPRLGAAQGGQPHGGAAEDDRHLRFLRQSCLEAKRRRRGGESADETGIVIFRRPTAREEFGARRSRGDGDRIRGESARTPARCRQRAAAKVRRSEMVGFVAQGTSIVGGDREVGRFIRRRCSHR
jgi:hypothetical protein